MKKSRFATTKLWAGLAILLLSACILAACGDNSTTATTAVPATTSIVVAQDTATPTGRPTTVCCTPPPYVVTEVAAQDNRRLEVEQYALGIPGVSKVYPNSEAQFVLAKAYPNFKKVTVLVCVAPQDSKTLYKQVFEAFTKAGYYTDNKFYGKDNLFSRPTDQFDTNDIRLAKSGQPDVALGVTSLERSPTSVAAVLNVSGINAEDIKGLSDKLKNQKSILVIVYAENLFGEASKPATTTLNPASPGPATPTPSPRFTPTDIVITAPPSTVGLLQPFQMPKVDGLTEINASAAVRNYFLKSFPVQNVTLRLYGSRNDAVTSATALDKALKQNGYEFALNGYQELLKQGEGDKTTLAGIYRHANQEGVLFAIINLPADRSQLAKHLSLNDLNASDEALLRSQLSDYSSFLAVVSSPDIVKIANGSLNVPTPTGSPNTYPK